MTREENRKIIESFQPMLESLIQKGEEDNVEIRVFISNESNYASVRIGDYELIRMDSKIRLEYMPLKNIPKWETEWKKEYKKKSSASDQTRTELN